MKYCPEIGKISDTLFYCLEYFNGDVVKDTIIPRYTDASFMIDCYQEISENVRTLPTILSPFFYCQAQTPAAISTFFIEQVDFEHDTIDSFIKKITSKSDILYSKILATVFPNDQTSDTRSIVPLIAPESYIEALNDSIYSHDFKLQVALLFGHFSYAISVLTEQLRCVYTHIDALHKKNTDKLDIVVNQIQSDKNAKLYDQLLDFDVTECCFSVSLLNQYTTQTFMSHGNNIGLLLGFNHEDDLHLQYDEKNIDLRQLLIAVGNDTRYSILQILMENKELTASSIAKMLNLPPTTALRHVELLYDNNVLYISRRSGLQIFYRINYDILTSAIKLLSNKLGGRTNERTNNNEDSIQMD